MNYLLLFISMTACLVYELLKKSYTKRYENTFYQYLFVVATSFVAIIVFSCFGFKKASSFTIWLGIAFGCATLIQLVAFLSALKNGPLSYTSIITAFSTVIPVLAGCIFWKEKISVLQIIGMVLMCVSILLSVLKNEKGKKANKSWYVYCVILFVCTGSIGVMQKIHQKSDYAGQSNMFLLVAFLCSLCLSSVISFATYKKNKTVCEKTTSPVWVFIVIAFVCGICCAFNNKLNLYLTGQINGAILFPLLNGGGAVLTTTFSVLLFKEKLSVKQWIGAFIGIAAIVLLCLN